MSIETICCRPHRRANRGRYSSAVQRAYLRISAVLVVIGLAVGCGPGLPSHNYAKEPDPRGAEFTLGVSDSLRVSIWRHPELSGTHLVPSHGKITVPLIGEVVVAGRTASVVRAEISKRMATYVKDQTAQVTVQVTDIRSYRFSVNGEVARADLFTRKRYVTVTEAIALAGGFTRFAKPDRMYIVRRAGLPAGKSRRIPLSYNAIIKGGREDMNIVVLTGDVIYVP